MTRSDAPEVELIAFQTALVGLYSLERELGRGGMGIVYLAREVALDRLVAIKLLPPEAAATPSLRERFQREARTAAQLSHPHIVPIFRVDEIRGFVFFVMAYIEGETLGQRVRRRGPLPPHEATRMLREVAWALAYAHARGIVHRDVKPDNILLEQGSGRSLVTDFGIAHAAKATKLEEDGAVLGTATFMSPEQAAGEPLDGRSDLYSLGVVAFYALSGRLPFEGRPAYALMLAHLNEPPPTLSSVAPATPRRLAAAVDQCLAKSRDDRPASGEKLAELLEGTSERAPEIPAPLRVWLTRGDRDRTARFFAVGYGTVLSTGLAIGVSPWFALLPLAVLSLPVAIHLRHTRRTLGAGYDYEDLVLGLRRHIERRREELAFEYGEDWPRTTKVLRWTAVGGITTAIALGFANLQTPVWEAALFASALVGVSTGVFSIADVIRRRLRNRYGALRLKFYESRIGRRFVELASSGLRRPAALAEHTAHRPTELAIGMAADALFEALPKETKRTLRDLPGVVRGLESHASRLRTRIRDLDELLAGTAAPVSLATASPEAQELEQTRRATREQLRTTRDAARGQLASAVAALETIRLDLLRLRAGDGDADQLTAAMAAARRVGEDVEVALAAQLPTGELLRPAPPLARRIAER